jgi:hypothetical protein
MNYARYQQLESGQSSIARKVLTVVPLAADWDSRQIRSEMFRLTHSAPDLRTVEGCLRALVEAGLVKAIGSDHFRRVMPPPMPVTKPHPVIPKEEPMTAKAATDTAFDKMAKAAGELRTTAKQLIKVADEFEEAALQAQQQIQEERKKSERFHQLRQLLAEDGQ